MVPDTDTQEGKLVSEFRKKFNSLQIEQITFGVTLNPELQPKDMKSKVLSNLTKEGTYLYCSAISFPIAIGPSERVYVKCHNCNTVIPCNEFCRMTV